MPDNHLAAGISISLYVRIVAAITRVLKGLRRLLRREIRSRVSVKKKDDGAHLKDRRVDRVISHGAPGRRRGWLCGK